MEQNTFILMFKSLAFHQKAIWIFFIHAMV